MQREIQADAILQAPNSHLDVEAQNEFPVSSTPPTIHVLQNPIQSTSAVEGYSIGTHSVGDGVQFFIFSLLSLLGFAIILTIGCFYVISIILFPFGEIPTLCVHTKRDLKSLNKFYRTLFTKIFRFTSGLWD